MNTGQSLVRCLEKEVIEVPIYWSQNQWLTEYMGQVTLTI